MQDDRRAEERDSCQIEASIQYGSGVATACVVTNLSEHGARIAIAPAADLPCRFKLALPVVADITDHRLVELRWREGAAAGVQFVS